MIEIVCKDRLQEEEEKICLPKNIRQIGSPRGRHKIYIEDYVYTYLRSVAQKKESCAVIFLGKSQVVKDIRYTFISGAAECGPGVFQWDSICLDDGFWQYIEEERKQYFPDKEIVGWFLGKTGQAMELTPVVEAAHRKYFPGRDKVLMLMDVLEEEEVLFIYDQGYLQKREGYYIYYEKNLPMQEYMVQKKEETPGEVERRLEEAAQIERAAQMEGTERLEPENGQQLKPEIESEFGSELVEEKGTGGEPTAGKRAGSESAVGKETGNEPTAEKGAGSESAVGTKTEIERKMETGAKTVSAAKESQEREEEFRALHKELEREIDTGNQEKIFAKSNQEEPKTQAEEALESYRHMILERQGRQIERQNRKFLYTASSFFLVVVCVLGITTINNYRKMQEVEDVLHVMNNKEPTEKRSESEEGPVVESVMSQVVPLEESGETPSSTEAGQPAASDGQGTDKPDTSIDGQTAGTSTEAGQGTDKPDTSVEGQAEDVSGETGQGTDKSETAGEGQAKDTTSEETSAAQPETRYYIVQPGDTLGSICINVYHDRNMMAKVCEANGIEDGDKIYIGQKLLLP